MRIYRLRDVCRATGLSKSTIYRMAADGKFPKPFKITDRASGWDAEEVERWIAERIAAREAA